MKTAEDYFWKYKPRLIRAYSIAYLERKSTAALRNNTYRLFREMWNEGEAIRRERHVKKHSEEALQIINEQNQKWNDICDLCSYLDPFLSTFPFAKKNGGYLLEKDHFLNEYKRLYQKQIGEAK